MTLTELQGYAYFFLTVFLVVILYGYILHLYRSEKKGEADYEKYGKMALDDELHDKPVEANPKVMNEKKER
ncbi:cytochrome c oxidase, cbb3-type, CcoQ subunit [Nitratifractor salsuginis]|uniref:Cytochrome c oxidase, cbb3-type, CcoQ subunit n=1 Tax=Nitratifractor salsuginis (strain DSM 16511 / JCM 12458 / E9I37-1) TaxID=749222 RepID=E6X2H5_NITSE|nr:cytochrome c oxidase, cbb3-type, CcoQ subunit [Nitratifractor salsuginis]ADV47180.1 cytochrome c oxidase, cbb3-type, CcoQ subunit [Nitratifractor salsuginis DSM 16511]